MDCGHCTANLTLCSVLARSSSVELWFFCKRTVVIVFFPNKSGCVHPSLLASLCHRAPFLWPLRERITEVCRLSETSFPQLSISSWTLSFPAGELGVDLTAHPHPAGLVLHSDLLPYWNGPHLGECPAFRRCRRHRTSMFCPRGEALHLLECGVSCLLNIFRILKLF